MNYKDLMQELQSLGTEQTRKTLKRHGVEGEMYGVSYAHLGALKKKIKVDHELAGQLWQSGLHDARILATMIADPAQGASLVDGWVKDVNSYVISDALATFAAQASVDPKKIEQW